MGKRKLAHVVDGEVAEEKEVSLKVAAEGGGGGGGSDEEKSAEVKVIGEMVKKAGGKGKVERRHYQAFEVDGNRYDIDDPVLVTPEGNGQKPYVAIIKDIKQGKDGTVQVTGQWFYRPEEAEKKGGGTWVSSDSRELFYSFHRDEVPAESVMHKCQVHFIPPNKQLPLRAKHPGFIVRRVYDACEKKLFNLTDKDYEDPMQREIDLLVQKTREVLGDLPDLDGEEIVHLVEEEASPEIKAKRRVPAKRTVAPLNVKSEEFTVSEPKGQAETPTGKAETPTSTLGTDVDVSSLLRTHDVLVGVHARDRWLEKLVQTIGELCGAGKGFHVKNEEGVGKEESDTSKPRGGEDSVNAKQVQVKTESILGEAALAWPEVASTAIEVVSALEKLSHDSLGNDLHKYNLKMRQLDFNVKSNKVLATRLLSRELEPSTVINMSPAELKDGFTAAENTDQEPPEQETIQMADVRCSICTEREVGVKDIIHGGHGDRYQLECLKCGHSWYSSRDAVSSLEIKTTVAPTVGVAPWATSKFEEVEKDLITPSEPSSLHPGDSASGNISITDLKTDLKVPVSPRANHYEEVENLLTEKLPVTNPVVKTFVNVNSQESQESGADVPSNGSAAGIEIKHTTSPAPDKISKPELVMPHPDVLDSIPSVNIASEDPEKSRVSDPHPPLTHQESTVATIESVPICGEEQTVSKGDVDVEMQDGYSDPILPSI